MTEYEQLLAIKKMNRKQKRALAKKLNMSYADLIESINFDIVDMNIEQIPEGTQVKINYDKVMEHKDELSERYISWITEHKNDIFTCEKDTTLPDNSHRVQLKEDSNEVKWLFNTSDLILVDENGNPIGSTLT